MKRGKCMKMWPCCLRTQNWYKHAPHGTRFQCCASQHNFCFEVRSGLGLLKNLVFAVHLTSPSNYRLQSKKPGFRRKTLILPIGRGPWYRMTMMTSSTSSGLVSAVSTRIQARRNRSKATGPPRRDPRSQRRGSQSDLWKDGNQKLMGFNRVLICFNRVVIWSFIEV